MKQAVFFDFDGTLADTAPDLVGAANQQRERAGLAPLSFETLRPFSSQGAPGLLKAALDLTTNDPLYPSVSAQFLIDYANRMTEKTRLYEGIAPLLDQLDHHHIAWGIVTNKAENLSFPLFKHLGLYDRSVANIAGDTAARPKPYPDPLFLAAQLAQVDPKHCLYIGDDERDIVAGKAAGMKTIAIAYGYWHTPETIPTWQADAMVDRPEALWETISHLLAIA